MSRKRLPDHDVWEIRAVMKLDVFAAARLQLHCGRSHDIVIRVYDHAGSVIETHEHRGECANCKRSAVLLIAAVVGAAVQL